MKKIKPYIYILLFIVFFCIINSVLTFALVPTQSHSKMIWSEYQQEKKLDSVIVGSSVAGSSFNPYIINEGLDINSFNMGSPAQPLKMTYLTLEKVFAEHEIEKVFMGFSYSAVTGTGSEESEAAFLNAQASLAGGAEKILVYADYITESEVITTERSINLWFPWVYYHVDVKWEDIKKNIREKMRGTADEQTEGTTVNLGKGYVPYQTVIDYETAMQYNSYSIDGDEVKWESIQELIDICKLCEENGVELYVINPPRPAFDIASYGTRYFEIMDIVKEAVEENGAEYYDFNLAKDELFQDAPDYYYDYSHLNQKGADVFSTSLVDFIKRKEAGDKVQELFYTSDEYMSILSREES